MTVKSKPWAHLAGAELMAEDFLREMKAGEGADLLYALGVRRALARLAEAEGIRIPKTDIEDGLTEFFADKDLIERGSAAAWLKSRCLSKDDVRLIVRERRLVERLKEKRVPPEAVEKRFAERRTDYARASANVVTSSTEGAARELMLSVREGEMPWPGGEIRELTRAEAPEEIAAAFFAGEPKEIFGPFEAEEGYEVWRLDERSDAVLDDDLRERIREQLFNESVDAMLRQTPLEFIA